MNEDILKEVVNFGATMGDKWENFTICGKIFLLSRLFAKCREAKKEVEKNSVTDFERGSWLLIQSRIILKLESVATVEMIKTANFSNILWYRWLCRALSFGNQLSSYTKRV